MAFLIALVAFVIPRPRLSRVACTPLLAVIAAGGAVTAVGAASTASAQSPACVTASAVSFAPLRARPGTLVTVQLAEWRGAASPTGSVAGEPLHFRPADNGAWRALAAVPIDARALALRLTCPRDTPAAVPDTITVALPLTAASYPLEKLRVAPEFSAKPDSALQARLDREAARAAAVSRNSHDTPPLWNAPFRPPRDSRITSSFGRGREFNGTVTSRHMGTDYAGGVGAPIRAANRGVVRIVDRFYLGGNVVYLDHGDGLVTAYLHLSEHRVAEGDTVEQGAIIGLVGATGRVTGPHLHWIARYGRISVDPASLLRATRGEGSDSSNAKPAKSSTPASAKRHPKGRTGNQ
ncbi:MAG: M23 family metallopeptidase [Gemmatimonadaceae bacterium]|nr:M23 family metallopeptidase [Gemmatimonadaceae bacterium]